MLFNPPLDSDVKHEWPSLQKKVYEIEVTIFRQPTETKKEDFFVIVFSRVCEERLLRFLSAEKRETGEKTKQLFLFKCRKILL